MHDGLEVFVGGAHTVGGQHFELVGTVGVPDDETHHEAVDEVTATLDTSGLLCPLPVYRAAQALNDLEAGGVLELTSTDPGAIADIPALARQRGDVLVGSEDRGGRHVFWIRKGGAR